MRIKSIISKIPNNKPETDVYNWMTPKHGESDIKLVKLEDGRRGIFKYDFYNEKEKLVCLKTQIAYELNKFLNMNIIPETLITEFEGRKGSLQIFIENTITGERGIKEGIEYDEQEFRKLALFDFIFVNPCRYHDNWLIDDNGKIYGISNGYILHWGNAVSPNIKELMFRNITDVEFNFIKRCHEDRGKIAKIVWNYADKTEYISEYGIRKNGNDYFKQSLRYLFMHLYILAGMLGLEKEHPLLSWSQLTVDDAVETYMDRNYEYNKIIGSDKERS